MRQFSQILLLASFFLAMLGIAIPHAGVDVLIAISLLVAFAINAYFDDVDWRDGYSHGYSDAYSDEVDLTWVSGLQSSRNTASTEDAIRALKYRNGHKG